MPYAKVPGRKSKSSEILDPYAPEDMQDGSNECYEFEEGKNGTNHVVVSHEGSSSSMFSTKSAEGKNATSLLLISGSDTLLFFNYLAKARNMLISNVGPFAGLPPTILSPVAFHGATLKCLKVHLLLGMTIVRNASPTNFYIKGGAAKCYRGLNSSPFYRH